MEMLRRWETSQAFHKHLRIAPRLLMSVPCQRWARITVIVSKTHWFLGECLNGGLSSSGSLPSVPASIPLCSPMTVLRGNLALCFNGIQAPSCSREYLQTWEALSLNHLALESQNLRLNTKANLPPATILRAPHNPQWDLFRGLIPHGSYPMRVQPGAQQGSDSVQSVWSVPKSAGRASILLKPSPNQHKDCFVHPKDLQLWGCVWTDRLRDRDKSPFSVLIPLQVSGAVYTFILFNCSSTQNAQIPSPTEVYPSRS